MNRLTLLCASALAIAAACASPATSGQTNATTVQADATATQADAATRQDKRSARAPHDDRHTVEVGGDFGGLWNGSYGAMRLVQHGTHVSGRYAYGGGATIEGDVADGRLHAIYTEPDGVRGSAMFELSADGNALNGVWKADPSLRITSLDQAGLMRWDAQRVAVDPERPWLVILEAHWEGSLAEPEYSYGEMLRSFFRRLPQVSVRHRFFHDQDDLLRFVHEIEYLPGPVVLYISSHGTQAGVSVAGHTIDGTALGKALQSAGDVRLLHLGGCLMMGGDMKEKIHAASAPHARFPISGFVEVADWAGSAIVDMTYLDLLLEHELEPADAVQQVCSMLSFAGAQTPQGCAIPAMGLVVSN